MIRKSKSNVDKEMLNKSGTFYRHHLCFIPRAAAVVLGSPVEERLVGDVRLVDGVGRDHGFRVGRLKNEAFVSN